MRAAWLVPVFALGGCNACIGLEDVTLEVDASGGPDAAGSPDAASGPDATPPCDGWDYAPSNVPCPAAPAREGLTLASGALLRFYTDDGSVSFGDAPPSHVFEQDNGVELRVIEVNALTLENSSLLEVYGSRPLVILVDGAVTLNGGIRMRTGSSCAGGAGGAAGGAAGGGGGGGGGMAEPGGMGGAGVVGSGGTPGAAQGDDALRPLVGGCGGGRGGDGTSAGGGEGGVGGGALQISARLSITVTSPFGSLSASGLAGVGGASGGSGGGGGGAGGAILLEAPLIDIDGEMCAGGGSGGEGGGASAGASGEPGSCLPASTENGQSAGGNGGSGGVDGDLAGSPGGSNTAAGGGGGGGGGAAGRIHLRGDDLQVTPGSYNPRWTESPL